jgi:hypothetical protein
METASSTDENGIGCKQEWNWVQAGMELGAGHFRNRVLQA